jgi:hypothetical protein
MSTLDNKRTGEDLPANTTTEANGTAPGGEPGDPRHSVRRHRLGKHPKLRNTLLAFVVGAVVAVVVVLGAQNGGLVSGGQSHVDSTTIKNSFSDVAELATEEYNFANVGKYTEDDLKVLGLSIPFTGSSFLVTYEGTAKAGIKDISQATVKVDDSAKKVSVTLPKAQVLSCSIDPSSVQTYDQSFNPINQITVDDVTTFLTSEEKKASQEAVDGGLIDKADSHAQELVKAQVEAVLKGAGEDDYEVSVTSASE